MYLKSNGINIYYQTTSKGPDLILLHGWKQDVSTWWGVVDLLKDDFKIWLVDLPGFGRSDSPIKPWTVSDYADTIAEFIKKQNIKKPILLGHSLGGNVSIKLASQYANLISKLILEDSSGLRKKSIIKQNLFMFMAKIVKYGLPNFLNLKERLRVKFYTSIGSDYLGAGELKETFQNMVDEDLSSDAKKISTDTLILWGEQDREVPLQKGKQLYHLIRNSRVEVFEGIGHFPHLENVGLFIYYVKDFSLD